MVLPVSASTTSADTLALARGLLVNSSSSWVLSHSRRCAGSFGGFGRSADGPGRAVVPSSGRGPPLDGGPSTSVGAGVGEGLGGVGPVVGAAAAAAPDAGG